MSPSPYRLRTFAYLLPIFVLSLLAFAAPRPAQAADLEVCSTCTYTTVGAAVAAANDGDVILVHPGIYTEVATIYISSEDLVIEGTSANPNDTTIRANALRNQATYRVFTMGNSTVTIRNVTIQHGNPASGFGGAIDNNTGNNLTLENVIITANDSIGGGAIYNVGTLTLRNTRITNNNVANANGGGGIFNTTGGTVNIYTSTIDSNTTTGSGGGIRNNNGIVNIINSTISGNNTGSVGGGIYNDEANTVTTNVQFSTLSGNIATTSNPGVYNASSGISAFTLQQSILTNHGGADCGGSNITSGITNLIDGLFDCNGTPGRIGAVTGLNATLADNGGATPTHALGTSSNAIDAAIGCPAPAVDQRGEARNDGLCDIGAFELVLSDGATISRSTFPATFGPAMVRIPSGTTFPTSVEVTKKAVPPGGGIPSAGELPVTWTITATGSPFDVNVSFCYTDTELGSLTESSLQAYRWDGVSSWVSFGGTVDTGANCVTVTGVTEFSSWALATGVPSAVTLANTAVSTPHNTPTPTLWLIVALLGLLTAVVGKAINYKL